MSYSYIVIATLANIARLSTRTMECIRIKTVADMTGMFLHRKSRLKSLTDIFVKKWLITLIQM